jgi:hypothetical protein
MLETSLFNLLYILSRNCNPINYNDEIDNNLPLIEEL